MSDKQRAVNEIRERIIRGDLTAESVLSENELAGHHKMSRTPIREALNLLAAEGLIELIPGRGARVRRPQIDEIRQLLAVRYALESLVGWELAVKRDEVALSSLGEILDRMDALAEESEKGHFGDDRIKDVREEFVALDLTFHRRMAELSGLSIISDIILQYHNKLRVFTSDKLRHSHYLVQVAAEHREIIGAVRSGNTAAVNEAIKKHMVGTAKRWFPDVHSYINYITNAFSPLPDPVRPDTNLSPTSTPKSRPHRR